jgi:flagellin
MSIVVNTNVDAIISMRHLSATQNDFTRSVERLASGMRINHAADDAAGLSISEKLRAQVRGFNQAARNSQDAISLIQTAEGALNETASMLQRMRELAVQGANDTLVTLDRGAINAELIELSQQITNISDQTTFNTQNLLDGSFDGTFQVGPDNGNSLGLSIAGTDSNDLGLSGVLPTSASTAGQWASFIDTLDTAINSVSDIRSNLGAKQNRLEHIIRNLQVGAENSAASESRIRDADVAMESVNLSRAVILRQAGVSVLAQANAAPQMVMQLLQ